MTDLISALSSPVADEGTGFVTTGMPVSRIDGRDKVSGQAHYAADMEDADMLYGVVVNSNICKGHITDFVLDPALSVPGVVDIITHTNRPKIRSFDLFYKDMTAPGGSPFRPLYDDKILYSGQPVALVLAQTFEAARHAASLVELHADIEEYETDLKSNLQHSRGPGNTRGGSPPPREKGNADEAYAQAAFKIGAGIKAQYDSAAEHHNPMELFATTVIRDGDGHLTIYDKTQSSQNSRWYISRVFGLSSDKVTVRNPYVGGAFGAGLRPQYQLPLAVMAALKLKRSVKVVMTRQQMFGIGHRPETVQTVKLAADQDGTLKAIIHKAITTTSRFEEYVETIVNWSGQLYACDNIKLAYELVSLDQSSPMNMRAPGAAQGIHALEVAMDELAYQLRMDPLAFRLKNYADIDPSTSLPYSSKELRACYQQGAARFGWKNRPLEPRSMRNGSELIGYGMATGIWDAMQFFARASAVLYGDGRLVV
ncbi:MAG: molybdopterin cofactor-binding domain-containing protein, partial [Pseudomonadota bacterium]